MKFLKIHRDKVVENDFLKRAPAFGASEDLLPPAHSRRDSIEVGLRTLAGTLGLCPIQELKIVPT